MNRSEVLPTIMCKTGVNKLVHSLMNRDSEPIILISLGHTHTHCQKIRFNCMKIAPSVLVTKNDWSFVDLFCLTEGYNNF